MLSFSGRRLFACSLGLLSTVLAGKAHPAAPTTPYTFEGRIDQPTLERYLARSIQYMGLCAETPERAPYFEDSLRLVRELRPKFIGRAALAWDVPADDEAHYALAKQSAAAVHAIDPEIILQACVFETAYSANSPETAQRVQAGFAPHGVEQVPVPAWVFSAFGVPVEQRTFNYEAMLYRDGHYRNLWLPGASVPDVSQLETRLWLYYRACRYIDAGFESIHMGQVMLMDDCDPQHEHWIKLLEMVRAYGREHSRRHYVLLDAHLSDAGIIAKSGRLLWDFVGYPLRVTEGEGPLEGKLQMGRLDSIYNRVPGGVHPSGWTCAMIPQLYEIDNCASEIADDNDFWIWGADESTWFANLKPAKRDAFLQQAWAWIWNNAPHGYLEMPGRRPARVPVNNGTEPFYMANNASAACPPGFGQEAVMRAIWNDPRNQQTMDRAAQPESTPASAPQLAAMPPASDGLVGHWTFADLTGPTPPRSTRNLVGSSIDATLARGYLAAELKALYLVHGDRNAAAEVARGERELAHMQAAMLPLAMQSPHGMALRLQGGPYLNLGSPSMLASRPLTLAMWIKADQLDRPFTLLEKSNWTQKDYQIAYAPADRQLYAEVRDASNVMRRVSYGVLAPGAWTHVALTITDSRVVVFLNGRQAAEVAAKPEAAIDHPLVLGRAVSGVQVADLRIYARELPVTELGALVAPAK